MDKAAKFPARKPAKNENNLSLATPAIGTHETVDNTDLHFLTKINHAKIEKPPAFEGRAGGIGGNPPIPTT